MTPLTRVGGPTVEQRSRRDQFQLGEQAPRPDHRLL